jgi:squalene-associated FAD-dependent desaturase
VDNGPHVCIGAYHHFLAFLTRIGSRDCLVDPAHTGFTFWDREQGVSRLSCPDWPRPWGISADLGIGLARFVPLTPSNIAALIRFVGALLRATPPEASMSVTHWAGTLRQTPWLFRRLWLPLCLATLNEYPASASAALFVTVLRAMFLSGDRHSSRLLRPSVPLQTLIADPAVQWIRRHGGHVLCQTRVEGILTDGDRATTLRTARGDIDCRQRPVILALPPWAVLRLLPEWGRHIGLQNLVHAPIVSVHLAYHTPARLPDGMVGLHDATSQWLVEQDRRQGTRVSAVISAAYREQFLPAGELVARVHDDLSRICPQLQTETPRSRVVRERRATLAHWPEHARWRPEPRTPWWNLMLAGDWIRPPSASSVLPCTLESAAVGGTMALDAIARMGA